MWPLVVAGLELEGLEIEGLGLEGFRVVENMGFKV